MADRHIIAPIVLERYCNLIMAYAERKGYDYESPYSGIGIFPMGKPNPNRGPNDPDPTKAPASYEEVGRFGFGRGFYGATTDMTRVNAAWEAGYRTWAMATGLVVVIDVDSDKRDKLSGELTFRWGDVDKELVERGRYFQSEKDAANKHGAGHYWFAQVDEPPPRYGPGTSEPHKYILDGIISIGPNLAGSTGVDWRAWGGYAIIKMRIPKKLDDLGDLPKLPKALRNACLDKKSDKGRPPKEVVSAHSRISNTIRDRIRDLKPTKRRIHMYGVLKDARKYGDDRDYPSVFRLFDVVESYGGFEHMTPDRWLQLERVCKAGWNDGYREEPEDEPEPEIDEKQVVNQEFDKWQEKGKTLPLYKRKFEPPRTTGIPTIELKQEDALTDAWLIVPGVIDKLSPDPEEDIACEDRCNLRYIINNPRSDSGDAVLWTPVDRKEDAGDAGYYKYLTPYELRTHVMAACRGLVEKAQGDGFVRAPERVTETFAASVIKTLKTNENIRIFLEDMEYDPRITGLPGGMVLDLGMEYEEDGSLPIRPARRSDYVFKCVKAEPCDARDHAKSEFVRILDTAFGKDTRLRLYVRLVLGLMLVGYTVAQIMIFFVGLSGRGKSTFLEALIHALNHYGRIINPKVVDSNGSGAASVMRDSTMAQMHKIRVAYMDDIGDDPIDNAFMKRWTGTQKQDARRLGRDTETVEISALPIVSSNNIPTFTSYDTPEDRRLAIIPFGGPAQSDPGMAARLEDEAPVIIHEMVLGAMLLMRKSMPPKPYKMQKLNTQVRYETQTYRGYFDAPRFRPKAKAHPLRFAKLLPDIKTWYADAYGEECREGRRRIIDSLRKSGIIIQAGHSGYQYVYGWERIPRED